MKKIFGWLTSMRLAVALIAYVSVGAVVASIVPQGITPEAYRAMFPGWIASVVAALRLGSFFSSPFFTVPALLFLANLSACTALRFIRERKRKGSRRIGPDLLHLGIVALMLGSLLTAAARKEYSVLLYPGEGARLPDGSVLFLRDFSLERYGDGRPRDFVSIVDVYRGGALSVEGYRLRVNAPLRLRALSVFQSGYSAGAGAASGAGEARAASGLLGVYDPGYPAVVASLILAAMGLCVTLAQRIKEGA